MNSLPDHGFVHTWSRCFLGEVSEGGFGIWGLGTPFINVGFMQDILPSIEAFLSGAAAIRAVFLFASPSGHNHSGQLKATSPPHPNWWFYRNSIKMALNWELK